MDRVSVLLGQHTGKRLPRLAGTPRIGNIQPVERFIQRIAQFAPALAIGRQHVHQLCGNLEVVIVIEGLPVDRRQLCLDELEDRGALLFDPHLFGVHDVRCRLDMELECLTSESLPRHLNVATISVQGTHHLPVEVNQPFRSSPLTLLFCQSKQ